MHRTKNAFILTFLTKQRLHSKTWFYANDSFKNSQQFLVKYKGEQPQDIYIIKANKLCREISYKKTQMYFINTLDPVL